MMKISLTADKFGYYEVGGRTTYSKMEALEWASTTNMKAEWNFNRSAFESMDWKKEPAGSLWEMYKERARQIREEYDYVVLWYSGGSDSHNVLWAWLDAGLKIDEIATTWNYGATGDKQNHYNAEITNVVLPDIAMLKNAGYEFEFRLIDISHFCIKLFSTWNTEFEYNVNFHLSPNNPAKHIFRNEIDDYKNMIADGKKLCFVWGKEKPVLQYENGKHFFVFSDNIDNTVGPYVQKKYHQGWYDELFYWTPDMPQLAIKQAHVLKNYVESCIDESQFEPKSDTKFQTGGYSKRFDGYLKDAYVKTAIYPKWSNDIFCNGKAGSMTYSQRDRWFIKSSLLERHKFMSIMDSIYSGIYKKDFYDRHNYYPFYSSRYFLE
jgi:hypothetical protein